MSKKQKEDEYKSTDLTSGKATPMDLAMVTLIAAFGATMRDLVNAEHTIVLLVRHVPEGEQITMGSGTLREPEALAVLEKFLDISKQHHQQQQSRLDVQ